jgi:hypothetical protein
MIRRNPTLIPMGDFDVQDVRDMLAQQRADAMNQQQQQQLNAKRNAQAKDGLEFLAHPDATAAQQQVLKRLGLQPESGTLPSV